MKIAVCAKNEGLKSEVDNRFGRAENYVIYDTEEGNAVTIENSAKNEPSGAGGSATRLLSENKVEVVLAPELGPKAVDAIRAFGIEAYRFNDVKTVEDAINKYKDGSLEKFITSTTNSKHGLHRA